MYRSTIIWEKVIAVTNRRLCSSDFFEQIKKIGNLGVEAIVLREKDLTSEEYERMAEKVLRICEEIDTTCILHNFPEAARNLGCKELHVPLPVLEQMKQTGDCAKEECWIRLGTSVHSVSQAVQAEAFGATYMTAGHIFETDCKKGLSPRGIDFLRNICQTVQVPVYGIGGIHPGNMSLVLEVGAAGVCMMSELMKI